MTATSLTVDASTRDDVCPAGPMAGLLRLTATALGVPAQVAILDTADVLTLRASAQPAHQRLGELCQETFFSDAPYLVVGIQPDAAEGAQVSPVPSGEFAGFPLRSPHGAVFAVLCAHTTHPEVFSPTDLVLLQDAADSAAAQLLAQRALLELTEKAAESQLAGSPRAIGLTAGTTTFFTDPDADFAEALDAMPRSITLAQVERDQAGQPQHLTVRWANRHLVQSLGVSLSDIMGRSFEEVFPAVCRAGLVQRYLEVARSGEPLHEVIDNFVGEHVHGAFDLLVTPWSRDGLLIENTDVTERAQAKEALQRSQRMLSTSYHAAGIGSFEYDVPSGVATWSPEMYAIFGLDPARTAPDMAELRTFSHPEDVGTFDARVQDRRVQEGGITESFRIIRPDGSVRHLFEWVQYAVDGSGNIVRATGAIQDQTEDRERELARARSQELERLVLDLSPIGIALLDEFGRYVQVNDAFCAMVGYSRERLLDLSLAEITDPDDRDSETESHTRIARGESDSSASDKRYLHANGHSFWVSVHKTLLKSGADSQPVRVLAQIIDISERQQRAAELTRQARTDALTGLANRRSWEPRLHAALAEAQASHTPLAVGILDLDRFKKFNDTFGHPVGDELLVETSAAWRAFLIRQAPRAVLARLGGEEFGILLPGTDAASARTLLDGLGSVVQRGQTASAGFTLSCADDDATSIMRRADTALYSAKDSGRARVAYLAGGS